MIHRLALILMPLILASCTSRTSDRYGTREGDFLDAFLGATEYQRLYLSKSDHQTMYSEFEPMFSAQITSLDQEIREAYVKEMASQFRLRSEDETKLAIEQLQENEKFFTFIVSVATREREWNDLNMKSSNWRVILENPDASVQLDPERIEVFSQTNDTLRYFYPTMTTFTRTYKIRFERALLKDAPIVIFRISGVRGALSSEIKNRDR